MENALASIFRVLAIVFALVGTFLALQIVYAQDSENIVNIPTGTASPGCETTDACFDPATIIIGVGDSVTWINNDAAAHTVTSGHATDENSGELFDSIIPASKSFEHTFTEKGTFDYYCMVHPWMVGHVIVGGSTTEFSNYNVGVVNFIDVQYNFSIIAEDGIIGHATIEVLDNDANQNPEIREEIAIDVFSTSDFGGIDLYVKETAPNTGIFKGDVLFTITHESQNNRLRVANGDTITAEYEDATLPTTDASSEIIATTILGTIVEKEPIKGIPYPITLRADSGDFNNVEYQIKFEFEEEFEIIKTISGTFDSSEIVNDNTVVFRANQVLLNEQKEGAVAISFPNDDGAKKGTYYVQVTANGITKESGPIDPIGIQGILAVLEAIGTAFDLGVEIYDSSVSCFNLAVSDLVELAAPDTNPKFNIEVENCSEHPERIRLSTSGDVGTPNFGKNEFDLAASQKDTVSLTLIAPPVSEGTHQFTVTGEVFYNLFGQTLVSTDSYGSGYYQVENGKVIPEFGPLALMVIVVGIVMGIVLSKKYAMKQNFFQNM